VLERRRVSVGLAIALAVCAWAGALAAQPSHLGAVWDRPFTGGGEDRDGFRVLNARALVDGSLLALVQQRSGASAFQIGRDGTPLGSSNVFTGPITTGALDSFGSLAIVAEVSSAPPTESSPPTSGYDLLVMKYDALSGSKVWRAPSRIPSAPFQGAAKVAIGPTGHVFVSAAVYDVSAASVSWATIGYDGRTGQVLWGPARYGGSPPYSISAPSVGPAELVVDASGDLLVVGWAASSEQSQWAAIKYRGATGEVVWGPVRIGAVSTAPPPTVCPGPCSFPPTSAKAAFDRNGDLFLSVSSFLPDFGEEWLTAKYDGATGRRLWGPVSHTSGAGGDLDVPTALAVDASGNVVVGGSLGTGSYSRAAVAPADELIKYSGATGALLWGPVRAPASISSLVFDGRGDVVFSGTFRAPEDSLRQSLITGRFDGRSGQARWTRVTNPPLHFWYGPTPLVVDSAGNVTSFGGAYVDFEVAQHPELSVVQYAGESGLPIWGPLVLRNDGAATWPLDVQDGGAGRTHLVTTSGSFARAVVNYGPDGNIAWGPFLLGTSPLASDLSTFSAVASNGDLVVAATSRLARYSNAGGAVVWSVSAEDPFFQPKAICRDARDNVIITGIGFGGHWTTIKYEGRTGALLWTAVDAGMPANSGAPAAVAADSQGNVVVAGYWWRQTETAVWVIGKYGAASGEPIWGPFVAEGAPFTSGGADGLAIDDRDNVIVGGTRRSSRGASRELRKHSGADGSLLWGPVPFAVSTFSPSAMLLDSIGDVVVAGPHVDDPRAANPAESWNVSRFGADTGALIWGPKTFSVPRSEGGIALARDSSGGVLAAGAVSIAKPTRWMLVGYGAATGEVTRGPETHDIGGIERLSQIRFAGTDVVLSGTSGGVARTVRYGSRLAVAAPDSELPATSCGGYFLRTLEASNAASPVEWTVSRGSLPAGVTLDRFTGDVSGVLAETGKFSFALRVRDRTGATAERDFTMDVLQGGPDVPVQVGLDDGCPSGRYTLSVPGSFLGYRWGPGGETTPAIAVCPNQPTVYSVSLLEANGCSRRGALQLQPFHIEPVPRPPVSPPPRRKPRTP